MKLLLTFLLCIGTFAYSQAQDKIFLISGTLIECKVTEVGTEEIKYTVSTEADAAVFAVKKIDVLRIEFANGHIEKFKEEVEDPDLYKNNKKNAWKFDFTSPVYGSSIFGYERSIRPGLSLETNVGVIGMGFEENGSKPRGALFMIGPKFFNTPKFRTCSERYYHVLKGAYIQPQYIIGFYESTINYSTGYYTPPVSARETTTYINLMLNFGQQVVFNNAFMIDVYAGIGYAYSKRSRKIESQVYNRYMPYYGALNPGLDLPVAVTAGIKLGFLTR